MINMILTTIILLALLIISSVKSDEEINLKFGSFYHTNVVRGIAVFLILISHIGDKSGLRYFTPLGGIGVSIFLICSGYGLYKSYLKNGLENYFKKRFIGLLVPYWIIFSIFSIIYFEKLKIVGIIKGLFLIEVPSIFWYVQYITIFYVAFFVVFFLLKDKYSITLLMLCSLIMFIVNKNLLLGEQSIAFVIGVFLAKYPIKFSKVKIGFIGVTMIFIGALSLVLKQTELIRNANFLVINLNGIMLKTITGLGIMFFINSVLNLKSLKIFTVGGKYSYEVYLVHITLVGMLVGNFTLINIIKFISISMLGTLVLNILSKKVINNINKVLN